MAEAGAAEKIVTMKIAILGAGNMGGAIACGLVRSGACRADRDGAGKRFELCAGYNTDRSGN